MIKLLISIIILSIFLFAKDDFSVKISYFLTKENLSIEQIQKVKNFKLSNGESFGFIDDYCWLKIELKNNSNIELKRYFKFAYHYIEHILLYEDINLKPKKYGQLENFNQNISSLQNVLFKLKANPKDTNIAYLRIKSNLSMNIKIKHFSEKEYIDYIFLYKQLYAFVYGVLFAMLLYNFIIYLNIKEKAYLYYVLFHFLFLLGIIAWGGLGFEYLWAKYPIFNFYSYGVISNLLHFFDYMLMIHFLDTKKYLPKVTLILRVLAFIGLFFSITSLYNPLVQIYEIYSIFVTITMIGVVLYLALIKNFLIAKYFLIAKLSLFIGIIVFMLSEFALIEGSFFVNNFYIFAIVIEVILMSFILSYKFKEEREKRVLTEKMLISKHKLSTLGEMFNNIVHQWRQPLSQINSIVFNIESEYHFKNLNRVKLEDKLNSIETLTNYLSQTIDDFRNFSLENSKIEKFKIKTLIDETLSIINFSQKLNQIDIEVKYSNENISILSNKNELSQVLMIILNNAKDAFIENKTLKPKIVIDISEDFQKKYIKISNNGGEISNKIVNKIFKPYFSTKDKKSATGIGLYIVKLIIDKLKGSVSVKNNNQWVIFTIEL